MAFLAALRRTGTRRRFRRGLDRIAVPLGRLGLGARAGFYLVLVGLVCRVAALGSQGGKQTDANGALGLLTEAWPGKAAVAVAALGFVMFGVDRLIGASRDNAVPAWRRITTGLQGCFYLALAYVPISFLSGNHQTGSEQSQHRSAGVLLSLPAGQELTFGLGLVVLGVCGWQIRTALTQDYEDGMNLRGAPPWVHRALDLAGTAGIASRALVFVPIGIFLDTAAVTYRPDQAKGLDGELLALDGHAWGLAVLSGVAAGLLLFAFYSVLEARYRAVESGK